MNETDSKRYRELLEKLARMEIRGVSIDSRTIKPGELFIALKGDRFDGHDFVADVIRKGAWGAVVERGWVSNSDPAPANVVPVDDTLRALQDLASLHRRKFSVPVVGVTGSNGKTTTKEMLAAILARRGPVLKNEGNLNNHIGVPLTLMRLNADHRTAVVEMGMSARGEIDLLARITAPTVGVITNIGPAHLEFLGSREGVAEAKGELLDNLRPDGTAVLNADDRFIDVLKKKFRGRTITFGIDHPADVSASRIVQHPDRAEFVMGTGGKSYEVALRTAGIHNIANALAAAAGAVAVGLTLDDIKEGLEGFVPVAGRSEIKEVKGRIILADYYNANPASMEAAIGTLAALRAGKKGIAVLGDMLELGEAGAEAHRQIGRTAARSGVDVVMTIGALSRHIAEGAIGEGMPRERVIEATSHADAAKRLLALTKPGDVILLKGSRGMKMEKILEEF